MNTTYTVNADADSLEGWDSLALSHALRHVLAPLGVEVIHAPRQHGLGGLGEAPDDLHETVKWIVEKVVQDGPAPIDPGVLGPYPSREVARQAAAVFPAYGEMQVRGQWFVQRVDATAAARALGSARTPRKAASSRENGKRGAAHGVKGGRPLSLRANLEAVGIHGTTGQATEIGTLPAGTSVRRIERSESEDGPVWTFQARGPAGWFDQRSYSEPVIGPGRRYLLVDDLGRCVGETVRPGPAGLRTEYGHRTPDAFRAEGHAKLVRLSAWTGIVPDRTWDS